MPCANQAGVYSLVSHYLKAVLAAGTKVKSPAESHGPFDFYTLQSTIPAARAFRALPDSLCPALKHG